MCYSKNHDKKGANLLPFTLFRGLFNMSGLEESLPCIVCEDAIDTQLHHIFPTEFGGDPNGEQVPLCSTDHLLIHHLASFLTRKKKGNIKDLKIPAEKFSNPVFQKLVAFVIQAKNGFTREEHPEIERRIIIKIEQQYLTQIHKKKLDNGFSSLEKYILSLIMRDVSSL